MVLHSTALFVIGTRAGVLAGELSQFLLPVLVSFLYLFIFELSLFLFCVGCGKMSWVMVCSVDATGYTLKVRGRVNLNLIGGILR